MTLKKERNTSRCSWVRVLRLMLNCNKAKTQTLQRQTEGSRKLCAGISGSRSIVEKFCSSRKKFHLMEINWLGEPVPSRSL